MDLNLFNTVKSRFTDSTIAAIGGQLGLDPASAKAGFVVFVPVILAAMAKTSRQQPGFDQLLEIIRDDQYDGGMIDRLPLMLSSGKADEISSRGSVLIDKLLGSDADPITASASEGLGFKVSAVRSLWATLAPLVVDTIASEIVAHAWRPESFRKRLLATEDELVAAMPSEIADILELSLPPVQDTSNDYTLSFNSLGFYVSLVIAFIVTGVTVFVLAQYVFNPAKVDEPDRPAPHDADESATTPLATAVVPAAGIAPQPVAI
jgi:hypothetical protein